MRLTEIYFFFNHDNKFQLQNLHLLYLELFEYVNKSRT